MKSRVFQIIIVLLGLILVWKLTNGLWRLIRASRQIKMIEERVVKLEEEKRKLSSKQKYYQSPEFIEEEARNKLNMAKPGETVVILPSNINELMNYPKRQLDPQLPNWKKWWNLFF